MTALQTIEQIGNNAAKDFTVIHTLSAPEEEVIRLKYHFPRL
jgi:hypothetical protein